MQIILLSDCKLTVCTNWWKHLIWCCYNSQFSLIWSWFWFACANKAVIGWISHWLSCASGCVRWIISVLYWVLVTSALRRKIQVSSNTQRPARVCVCVWLVLYDITDHKDMSVYGHIPKMQVCLYKIYWFTVLCVWSSLSIALTRLVAIEMLSCNECSACLIYCMFKEGLIDSIFVSLHIVFFANTTIEY